MAHHFPSFNYDRLLLLGPLTDKKIKQYQKQGYYGNGLIIRDEKREKIVKARRDKSAEAKWSALSEKQKNRLLNDY